MGLLSSKIPSHDLPVQVRLDGPLPTHPPPQGRGLCVNVGAATAHTGKWMGGENVPGLASVEFGIRNPCFDFFTSPSTRGAAASVEIEQIAITHETDAAADRVVAQWPPGARGGG
jgi:hypothetical protein